MLIGELARRASTTPRAVRYYEERGLLTPQRTSAGYRVYDEAAVLQVQRIRALIDAGFDSGLVSRVLPCLRDGSFTRIDLCPNLRASILEALREIDDEAERLRRQSGSIRALLQQG